MNFSQGFLENMTTLAITAILTYFLIPYIFKRIEEKKLKEQKLFEADIARQAKIIESQVQLLETLAELLWEYQLAAIDVSYYDSATQKELYLSAVKKYQEKSGTLFSKIRAEISKALRLTSKETYNDLKKLYYEEYLPLDVKLETLIRTQKVGGKKISEWSEFNHFAVNTLSEMTDSTLNNLAKGLRLKGSDV